MRRRALIFAASLGACAVCASSGAFADPAVSVPDTLRYIHLYYDKQYQEAFDGLLAAGRVGDARAQFVVGEMYRLGQHVEGDAAAAAAWYRKAADQGHPVAQLALANLLQRGAGVPRDPVAAYQWAALAADRSDARVREAALRSSGSLVRLLSPSDRERADEYVAQWRPRLTRPEAGQRNPPKLLWGGTAFFVNRSGILLTNAHVAYMCPRLSVLEAMKRTDAVLQAVDFGADLATLQSAVAPSPFGRFAEEGRPSEGAPVRVVGYAFKRAADAQTVSSSGSVLDPRPVGGTVPWFETSVAIMPGQSGGPALDRAGYVIGVARGFRNESSGERQGAVVSLDAVSRFLETTRTPFERASSSAVERPEHKQPPATDFVVLLQCLG